MKPLFSFCIVFLCFNLISHAQIKNETLFTIDHEEFSVGEFLNSYQKNADIIESSSESIEQHLERYINFQLKLKSAYDLQLDTLQKFKKEFQRYYKQIADSYISNGEVTEAMVKETYDRTKKEIRASHILLNLPKHEKDTVETYQKALMIKKRIDEGEPFERLAIQYSEDPSVKKNAGDLNWFNTFKMVYEFENAAYNLEVGEVSNPVRSDFGYHIIKKTGERPSKGQLKTAHIMLLPGDSLQDPELRIQKIYARLQSGEDFHELAKQYSQDPNSASKGGYISAFTLGGLNSKEYENQAYALENPGDYTEPFKTRFGWHIVKLIEIIPLQPYVEVKEDYKKRLKSSSRSKILVSKIREDLEQLYTVDINSEAKAYFITLLDESFDKGKWRYEPLEGDASKTIIQVEDLTVDVKTFGEYLERQQRTLSKIPDRDVVLDKAIDELVYKKLLEYHKTQLPKIDPDFGDRIMEYKNGILIFDYMNSQVWQPVAEDTLAQKEYYKSKTSKFFKPAEVRGQLYTSQSKASLKELRSKLKEKKVNDTTSVAYAKDIIMENVSLEKVSSKLPKRFKMKAGVSRIYEHLGQYLLMNVVEVKDSRLLEFKEVNGRIISLLQEEREDLLISNLRSTYDVEVENEVVQNLKEQLEK
ncbi:peptidylprolyl isomerase [Psychroflexus tropicus]|uniref:peptidylprolyl isomerase n=1 Tax=Psychroflexus tropicus TaxID=197345 RepID=UPI00036A48C8|nr:peptidylprolyl isomerase [Psychroflexus tropicus]